MESEEVSDLIIFAAFALPEKWRNHGTEFILKILILEEKAKSTYLPFFLHFRLKLGFFSFFVKLGFLSIVGLLAVSLVAW